MESKNILISGAGIAGLTLAYWLNHYGFHVTVVEQSPMLREGGYTIDFFGSGFDVAEKMGILSDLDKADLKIMELVFVDKNNRRKGGLNAALIRKLVNGRFYNLLRSDLSKVIYNHLDKDIELIFGDRIAGIEQNTRGTTVTFKSGKVHSFDLVVGADGLHSNVRRLAFGPESEFEKYYGYYASSFTIENYLPGRGEKAFLSYGIPGKQVSIYVVPENKMTALFMWSSPGKLSYPYHDLEAQKQILRTEFDGMGWECPHLLSKLDSAPDFYFDSVSQIAMDCWQSGRVVLLGDACCCPSLLSGQGSTLAMAGAYILAGNLKQANGNYEKAFGEYEKIFRPFIANKQKSAQSFANSFIPKSNFAIWMRNTFTNLLFSSFAAKWIVKKFMTDKIELKDYEGTF